MHTFCPPIGPSEQWANRPKYAKEIGLNIGKMQDSNYFCCRRDLFPLPFNMTRGKIAGDPNWLPLSKHDKPPSTVLRVKFCSDLLHSRSFFLDVAFDDRSNRTAVGKEMAIKITR